MLDQLHQVFRLEPDREPPLVHRHIAEIADAQARDAKAVLVGVKRAHRFAESLADAVAAVRARGDIDADLALARIKADRVVG